MVSIESGDRLNNNASTTLRFDEDAVVELTGLISFQNLSSKFNNALDVPAQGFCNLPEQAKP